MTTQQRHASEWNVVSLISTIRYAKSTNFPYPNPRCILRDKRINCDATEFQTMLDHDSITEIKGPNTNTY